MDTAVSFNNQIHVDDASSSDDASSCGCLIPFPSEDIEGFIAALKKGPLHGETSHISWAKMAD